MFRSTAIWLFWGAFLALAMSAAGDDPASDQKGPVNVSVVFMTEMNIAELSLDIDPFTEWTKPIIAALENAFREEKSRRSIAVQITLHPKAPAEIEIAGKPGLSDGETQAILAATDPARSPRTKAADVCYRIVAEVNGGHPDRAMHLLPKLESPDEAMRSRLEAASTAEKVALLKRWAREQAIPLLAVASNAAEDKYAGVRNLGRALSKIDLSAPIDVEKWTERNPDFWRAMMEMAPGNPLVLATRVYLHVASGDFDKAQRLASIASIFDKGESGASRLLGDARRWMAILEQDIGVRIKKGIALHDRRRFTECILDL